jgi:hypothetical protein
MDIPVVFLTANGDQESVSSQQIAAAVESALTEWDSGLKRTKGWRRNEWKSEGFDNGELALW